MNTIELRPPYLIFLGSETHPTYTKTGAGLVEWRRELCRGQLSLIDDGVDLGLPRMSVQEAAAAGVRSLVVGAARVGGDIPDEWMDTLEQAASLGMDIVAGLHVSLAATPRLREAAQRSGARLLDVRKCPAGLPVGSGRKRSGKRVLMVGTDCAVGKKYTALALERDMHRRGLNADFRASGQTGIMIAGCGLPLDAVVSDFLSGAAELLSPANSDDHWDVIEGQGSMFHPGYAAVSLGLLLGSQPDAFVVCHEAGRERISGWDDFPLPTIEQVIERTVALGSLTNPAIACVGVSINSSSLGADERDSYLAELSRRLGLPCVDPLRGGTDALIERLLQTPAASCTDIHSPGGRQS
ncbi:DUF1611 domain-containing protein [Kineobactrum salinum]|uniref:DUF1611 domain-containing protein n=1 Tax=Kineobactrum salinum TaxID=2708301 RepID=A0A6C0TZN2_9GAMM|nr:DUF1611 domain-containing protein [Kineobactrum salinum]QIB65241.1 DUF1611 domain-containing protein [Kineobactrum salinum]